MMKNAQDQKNCVVVSVAFLEMTKDTDSVVSLIDEMRANGHSVVLALHHTSDNYKLSPGYIDPSHFSNVQEMVTLSNPHNYDVLACRTEGGKHAPEDMILLDKYTACKNAMEEYGGKALDISVSIENVRKQLQECKVL